MERVIDIGLTALILTICTVGVMILAGCATAAPIIAPVAIDCRYPDPGPKPDMTALAALTKNSTPHDTLTAMGGALAALAEDNARLRALMAHGR
jgi:hypothetical protein